MESIYQWLVGSGGNELLLNFKVGYITGVIVVLALIMALKILAVALFGSGDRVKEITIPHPDGDLVISSKAVADMVETLVAAKFKHLSISKINVLKKRDGLALEVIGSFHLDGGHLPDVVDELRGEIFKNLEARLGITRIKKVMPRITKAPATGKTFA